MRYISTNDVDIINNFFHFSRIDNRESIDENGLQAVAGGENEAGNDRDNKTIYFAKGISGVFKAVDVWARWEYDRYVGKQDEKINYGYEGYAKEVMAKIIYAKLYEDFKDRQYYIVDFIEGKDGDFEYGDVDVKKLLARDKFGRPSPRPVWEYGPYSDFGTPDNPNNKQEDWNMNTKIGERTIPRDRLKIVETQRGRSDALSVLIEYYNQYREMVPEENDYMFEILDGFIAYAKERYKEDKDFIDGAPDIGRREVDPENEAKYQRINKIKGQSLGEQVLPELSDTPLLDEIESAMYAQQQLDDKGRRTDYPT